MNGLSRIIAFALAAEMISVAPAPVDSPGTRSMSEEASGRTGLRVPSGGRVAGTDPIIDIAAVVTLTPSPVERVASLDPPPSAASVPAHTSFYVEIWATNTSNPNEGLACGYVDVQLHPAAAIHAIAPAQDSPLFPINVVPAVFDDGAGIIHDVGGCQTVPAFSSLGIDEWALVKTIPMNATARLGPVNVSLQPGGNVFAGTSVIGNVSGVDAADITYRNAVVEVECESGELPDLVSFAAFQSCFTGRASEGAVGPSCSSFDTDCDLDTDLDDYAGLVETLHGP